MDIKIGQKFGHLTILKELPSVTKNTRKERYVLCKCDCGVIKRVNYYEITRKTKPIKSCGCVAKTVSAENIRNYNKAVQASKTENEIRLYKSKKRLRNIRHCMIERCYNKKSDSYKYYGEKGITVYNEWLESAESFIQWSLNNGYNDSLYIDRINNSLPYCPDNCKWTTAKEQANNTSRNIKISSIGGALKTATEWGRLYNLSPNIIRRRYASHQPCYIEDIIYPPRTAAVLKYNGEIMSAKEIQSITKESISTIYKKYK